MEHLRLVLRDTSGPLPTSTYDLFDGETKVGFGQLRHQPNCAPTFPETMKSHVYYEIDPEFQGKGYGNAILDLLKNEARGVGMSEIWLTAYESNVASTNIIKKNGGEYLWDFVTPEGQTLVKYKIAL